MSALAEPGVDRRTIVRSDPALGHSLGFLVLRVVLAGLYAGYVAVQVPDVTVPVLAALGGLAAVLVFDAPRRAAWCACVVVVLAVLHARALPAAAPFVAVQLGLAAFVVASGALSLVAAPAVVRLGWVLALAGGLGLLVGAPAGLSEAVAGLAGGLLAGLRPLSALEVIVGSERGDLRELDRWLAWSPLVKGGR
jgi:hypothetical protein